LIVLHPVGGDQSAVIGLTIVMILIMTAAQFQTQRRIMARSTPAASADNPLLQQQRVFLTILPLVFGVGGILFPVGVLVYWTTTNLWTLAQQFLVK
jgi:YidC/Oxa1 family membrane protein insertase